MARGLKLRIKTVEGLNYLCSKNKGTDQLHGYSAADLVNLGTLQNILRQPAFCIPCMPKTNTLISCATMQADQHPFPH